MTNSLPQGSSGGPPMPNYPNTPGSGRGPAGRSSYASVVSGNTSNPNQPPLRASGSPWMPGLGTQGHLQTSNSRNHSRNPSRSLDTDMHPWEGQGLLGPLSRGGPYAHNAAAPLDAISRATGLADQDSSPPLLAPSYLRGSRYLEQLGTQQRAKLAAQREGRSSGGANGGSLSTSTSSNSLHKMSTSPRGLAQDVVERAPPFAVDDGVSPLPSRWSDTDKWGGLEITGDGLHVRFTGLNKTTDDAAAVRADHPMPRECGIYYFETTIHSRAKEALIGIGFSARKVNLNRLPGWEEHSWAYHSDDGYIFSWTANGKDYGPRFANGDIIGCGVNFRTGSAFFTKNGVNLGTAFNDIGHDKLYPSVGMKKSGDHLQVNFGDKPFVFDIDGMMRGEKEALRQEISKANTSKLHPPLDESALIQELIAQFLAHDGYVETARAFAEEVRNESRLLKTSTGRGARGADPEEDVDAIHRQQIRTSILEGHIDKALKLTNAFFPSVLRDNESIYFKLKCRKFIEMIRTCNMLSNAGSVPRTSTPNGFARKGKDVLSQEMEVDGQFGGEADNWDAMDTEGTDTTAKYAALLQETITYGQELRSEFSGDARREVQKALQDTFALIAYTDASQSNLASLLEISGRVPVAEELNSAILVSLGKSSAAALERLYQQSEALINELGSHGGAGAFINIRHDIVRDDPD
ncbi:MAG: hypothetical protein M1822_006374 [Bathelium mastoideum]|nr:MAG: hypothetical protein M1822_006374 [Bathelium mastoideum]